MIGVIAAKDSLEKMVERSNAFVRNSKTSGNTVEDLEELVMVMGAEGLAARQFLINWPQIDALLKALATYVLAYDEHMNGITPDSAVAEDDRLIKALDDAQQKLVRAFDAFASAQSPDETGK